MVHFLFYAGKARQNEAWGRSNPVGDAVQSGFLQEALDGARSRYSYEDLPSDRYGADFGVNFFDPASSMTLGQQVSNYLQQLGATSPQNAPNWDQMPDSDTGTPPSETNTTTKPMHLRNFP